jgi:hypothetical protein
MEGDNPILHFSLQPKPLHRDLVRILQRENEILETRIRLEGIDLLLVLPVPFTFPQLLLRWREPAQDVPFCVFNESQSVCAVFTTITKITRFETIAAACHRSENSFPTDSAKISGNPEMIYESGARSQKQEIHLQIHSVRTYKSLNAASFPTWRNVISMCLRSG